MIYQKRIHKFIGLLFQKRLQFELSIGIVVIVRIGRFAARRGYSSTFLYTSFVTYFILLKKIYIYCRKKLQKEVNSKRKFINANCFFVGLPKIIGKWNYFLILLCTPLTWIEYFILDYYSFISIVACCIISCCFSRIYMTRNGYCVLSH